MELTDDFRIAGYLRFFERPEGGRKWTQVLEAENIVLNQFYVDLFNLMGYGTYPPTGVADLYMLALALGVGAAPVPTAADTGLVTEWTTGASQIPQRMTATLYTPQTGPVGGDWAFFLASSANSVSVTFTEGGLMYNAPSMTAGSAQGKFATHAVFGYTKGPSIDLRIDYVLARIPT